MQEVGCVGSFQVFRGLLAYGEKLRKALLDEPGLEPLRCSASKPVGKFYKSYERDRRLRPN